ncbi:hypothetical protein WN943_020601 [Citrus x changshan-huyou]
MGSSLSFKALFGALAVGWLICLLLIGNLESGGNSTSTLTTTQSTANLKRAEALGREKFIDHPELDLNYMSKRRVPNGPDPIHNRCVSFNISISSIHQYMHAYFCMSMFLLFSVFINYHASCMRCVGVCARACFYHEKYLTN